MIVESTPAKRRQLATMKTRRKDATTFLLLWFYIIISSSTTTTDKQMMMNTHKTREWTRTTSRIESLSKRNENEKIQMEGNVCVSLMNEAIVLRFSSFFETKVKKILFSLVETFEEIRIVKSNWNRFFCCAKSLFFPFSSVLCAFLQS